MKSLAYIWWINNQRRLWIVKTDALFRRAEIKSSAQIIEDLEEGICQIFRESVSECSTKTFEWSED
jgi:ribosomal protein L20